MRREVWLIDPVHLTPYYDAALCQALMCAGWTVRQFTAPFLYDSALPARQAWTVDYLYGHGLNWRFWLNYPRLRRTLRTIMYLSGHRRLLRLVEAHPPDVVHVQWSRLPKFDRSLIGQIREHGIPVVHTVHDVEPLFAHATEDDLEATYTLADRLIVHTHANRDAVLARYPRLSGKQARVIPHIAVDFPKPSWASRAVARRELGIPAEAPVILFFGTARAYKGLEVLIEAFKQVSRVRPDLRLVVAGLQEKGHAVGELEGHVIEHRYYVPSDCVWAYHLAADVAVFPYHRVSQSGALITAMGFGLPVIVTDVGGLPETVDGNGWVVPCGSVEALGDALVEAVCDAGRLREMGARSRQLICERHAPETVAAQTVALYEEVIGSCGTSYSAPTA